VLEDGSTVGADGTVISPPGGAAPLGGGGAGGGAGAAPGGAAPGGPGGAARVAPGTAAPGGAAPVAPGTAVAAGDTSHCRDGRQFDPALEFFAPPCVPGKPGAPFDNGGASSLGVTKDKITIVHYIPDYGAEVNAIRKAQGQSYEVSSARVANAAFETFMNKAYQLYGRKIEIKTYQGTCRFLPPDLQCLIPEMNRIAKQFKPYAVFLLSPSICFECFGELARLKIVSFGGLGFSEKSRNEVRPYNYDQGMSSTRLSLSFAEWWCGSMAKKNAVYAGNGQNPAQDFRNRKRQLGIISNNQPDNKQVIKQVLYPALQKCGESVNGHEYFFESDVSTAAQQTEAATALMNSRDNPATSVVCICAPGVPQFIYNSFKRNNYWPEPLFAANLGLDNDEIAQTFMSGFACPPPNNGCTFDAALGLGSAEASVPPEQLGGIKIFKANSKSTVPLSPRIMEDFWQHYNMFASLVQATGPKLTPANMAASAPKLGSRGGGSTGKSRRAFDNGELSWTQDLFIAYWVKNKTSAYNDKIGAFTQAYGGRRFGLGQFPKGDPQVPTVDKRR
jgi:hypothetical protein